MSDSEPIAFRPRHAGSAELPSLHGGREPATRTTFNRAELAIILDMYGRKVAAGVWRDYAIDLTRDIAVFSVFRRAAEFPLYRIIKDPRLARKQGAYSVVAAGGLIMKRGHDLKRVLGVLEDRLDLVST